MSGKFRSRDEFQKIRDKFFNCCARRGYAETITAEVWRQIESFSGYSFSKAHSASFAVESYQSLFLKAYYPKEFMVAVINNFGGFYKTEIYIHEARRCGAIIEAPCINQSRIKTCIKKDRIFLGFVHLKSLESKVAQDIVNERKRGGVFRSLSNLIKRVSMGLEQMIILIRIGALRFTGQTKKELLWEAHLQYHGKRPRQITPGLFDFQEGEEYTQNMYLPELTPEHYVENAYDEIELLGFPLTSPFALTDWAEEAERLNMRLPDSEIPGQETIPMISEQIESSGDSTAFIRNAKGKKEYKISPAQTVII